MLSAQSELDIELIEKFIPDNEASEFFQRLFFEVNWKQDQVKVFGKVFDQPRLSAWCADPGVSYTYSGLKLGEAEWPSVVFYFRELIELHCRQLFNSALLNYYRDGNDYMGLHSDDEEELGLSPVVASLSFGAPRTFRFKHKVSKEKFDIELGNGDLLVMKGNTQHTWLHELPKRKRIAKPRINITFRKII